MIINVQLRKIVGHFCWYLCGFLLYSLNFILFIRCLFRNCCSYFFPFVVLHTRQASMLPIKLYLQFFLPFFFKKKFWFTLWQLCTCIHILSHLSSISYPYPSLANSPSPVTLFFFCFGASRMLETALPLGYGMFLTINFKQYF